MTRKIKFKEAFWGKDFCSTEGFDNLVEKFKEGNRTCRGIEDFIRNRAKAEEEYAKQLTKLTKSANIQDLGSICNAWDTLTRETEKAANERFEVSEKLYSVADRLHAFAKSQEAAKKHDEDQAKKSSREKRDMYKKTTDSKKIYEKCCQEAVAARETFEALEKHKSSTPTKDYDRGKSRFDKTSNAETQADNAYRKNVDNVNILRVQWELDMGRYCDTIEDLEEKRLKNLRNELWIYSNIISQTSVYDDERAENLRKALEHCDFDNDIELFINNKQTGREKPDAIAFDDFYKTAGSHYSYANNCPSNRTPNAAVQTLSRFLKRS